MREKDYNTGLRGVLFEAQHHARMGSAIWLYGWLVLRQTHQTGTTGWVLGGAPITYREIEEETGFNPRTLERSMSLLRKHGYIATASARGGVIVRILKAKKHGRDAGAAHPTRKIADGVRTDAERRPQNCVAPTSKTLWDQSSANAISSSSVVRIKEIIEQREIHSPVENFTPSTVNPPSQSNISQQEAASLEISDCERLAFRQQFEKLLRKDTPQYSCINKTTSTIQHQNPQHPANHPQNHHQTQGLCERPSARPPTQQQFPWELRTRMRLLRAERDDEVRRELAVGTGPEVKHP
ncbi:MAG: hypothetical protein WB680_07085 [Candidatus Acidiferrales bacterium]